MKSILILFALFVQCLCENNVTTTLKLWDKTLPTKSTLRNNMKPDSVTAKETVSLPPDQGGNYGDLIYRSRQNGDSLLVRDVVLIPSLDANEQDFQWYTSLPNARSISSVRMLNIGRQRAYTLRIDVAGQDAQVVFRVPSYADPRVLIEVYGY
ncbi:unnamed protein product [Brassicogethes aeneus]|uniref:Uncharacterized protein n=1 Tax=Brassicogethes aeneus TaxID=1431903 RepID=A0A9P0B7J4_BRAAE|nr:unnamed protein product [Brassicogethes aeneus]